ncbi:hypothetical protein B0H13DRAFT_1886935 [Mycena leptocephala]|nr:hypothetical protein B0H13DRAFT_1886935 [Mycena leptocephala]
MGSRAPGPDDEASQYNDGKGLQFTIEFAPLLNPNKKAHWNAKIKLQKKTFYVHGDSALSHMLYEAIKIPGRKDDLKFSWTPRDDKYTSTTIDIRGMTYTISETQFKDMALTYNKDYDVLLTEVMKKAKPETVRTSIAELKTYKLMEEEIEQNELIKNLNAEWKHEDRGCKRSPCFPDRTWAGAIIVMQQEKVVNEDGQAADLKYPPDDKIFSHLEPDTEDLTLVRNRETQKASAKGSNITINLTLPETAVPSIIPAHPHQPAPPPRPRIAAQMPLEMFCHRFSLGQGIFDKLRAYSVTGPHTLRHLKNTHLEEAHLNPTEIADVRDAQDQ